MLVKNNRIARIDLNLYINMGKRKNINQAKSKGEKG